MTNQFRRGNTTARRLTPEQVLRIRERYASGETQGALSREFQVSVGQVGRIVRGESWQKYTQVRNASDLMHENALNGVRPPNEEELARRAKESEARLLELLKQPVREPLTYEQARGSTGLERLAQEAQALAEEGKVESELEEFIGK